MGLTSRSTKLLLSLSSMWSSLPPCCADMSIVSEDSMRTGTLYGKSERTVVAAFGHTVASLLLTLSELQAGHREAE